MDEQKNRPRGREEKQDIFDRIMALPGLRVMQPFYARYKEQLLYLLFGGLTTLLSIGLFWLFTEPMGMAALAANIICWIACVGFAYITNRTWVFADKARDPAGIARECGTFFAGRLATLVLEELVLWAGIDGLGMPGMPVKIVAQVLVIVGNYVISKWLVFRKK